MRKIDRLCREYVSEGKTKRETMINVNYELRREIAPKDRKKVRGRLRYSKKNRSKLEEINIGKVRNIAEYLVKKEDFIAFFDYNFWGNLRLNHFLKYLRKDGQAYGQISVELKTKISLSYLRLGLEIKTNGENKLEEILDIEKLERFVLKGEVD